MALKQIGWWPTLLGGSMWLKYRLLENGIKDTEQPHSDADYPVVSDSICNVELGSPSGELTLAVPNIYFIDLRQIEAK